ncbi:O-antigen ligase family protein [Clostridium sp. AL.422]|uniref:O-antigen ligase family protein n=1 Tax=Clostridium TaxID=1485 RepID=UPI00293DFC4A|nr:MULTISPECIES: O-antigen ligase family protein [unclassified Clostridium]MDV4150392.1 O-antigen ligase family protein [Clostridium sp. AL.422]
MFKEKIFQNKIYVSFIIIALIILTLFMIPDISILSIYFLLLVQSYKWLKKDFFKVWAYTIVLIFCQFFILDNILTYIFNLKEITMTLLKFWKEIIIIESIYILLIKKRFTDILKIDMKKNRDIIFLGVSILLFIISMLITINKSESLFIAIYGMRNYIIGYIVLLIFMLNKASEKDIYLFINRISTAFVYLSIWGIFQAVFLGDKFLLKLGYGVNGVLSSSYYISGYFGRQRVVSTFASPNTFGLIAAMFAIFFVYKIYNDVKNNKDSTRSIIYFLIVFIALVLSYSRSAYVAFAIGFIIFVFIELNKKVKVVFTISIIIVSILVVVLSFLLVDKIDNMFINHIFRTITLRDTSALGHIDSTVYAIEVMKKYPFGVGVGMSGQKSLQFINNALHAENSYFIVGFDLGFLGLAIYIISLIILAYIIIKICRSKIIKTSIDKLVLIMFVEIYVSYMFLPTIQELEVAYLFFSIVGLIIGFYNRKIEKSGFYE